MASRRDKLNADLAALAILSPAQLREHWSKVTGKVLTRVSPAMLRLALAQELQAKALGGLSRGSQQRLDQAPAAKTQTSSASPGIRLVREHNGQVHIVTISETCVVEWNGRTWRLLSEVARAITGTHWSGCAVGGSRARAGGAVTARRYMLLPRSPRAPTSLVSNSPDLAATVTAVIARAPDWMRADLLSKEGPTRTAAEEALADGRRARGRIRLKEGRARRAIPSLRYDETKASRTNVRGGK